MRVLIAFDKFKDAISASTACQVAARALRGVRRDWEIDLCPLTDGGDGFEEIIGTAVSAQRVSIKVTGPRGDQVDAGLSLALLERFPEAAQQLLHKESSATSGRPIAIIEMARASGLALLSPERRNPWVTTTHGTGQLIRAAAELGASAILLGIGGSATNDLGLGALQALGFEFRGADGSKIRPPFPSMWDKIAGIEGALYDAIPPIIIASDVANPLLGALGCASIYGPQKGLRPDSLSTLEAASRRIAQLLCHHCNQPWGLTEDPGSGAAGGIAFGLVCAARARLQPGFELTTACLDLPRRVARADLVITGEGSFDASSHGGKAPGALIALATSFDKPVKVFAGSIQADARRVSRDLTFRALSPVGPVTREQLDNTAASLAREIQDMFRS